MMAENAQPLTDTTINAIRINAATINDVANAITNATGVSVTSVGIASPIAREMNKDQIDYPQIFVPFRDAIVANQYQYSPETGGAVYEGPATNDSLMQNYAYVTANNVSNIASTGLGIVNRLTNPTLNDIGPGKVELVGWVEPFAKPITPNTIIDRYRFRLRSLSYGGQVATPILCTTRKQAA
jgi:hypothetical protein